MDLDVKVAEVLLVRNGADSGDAAGSCQYGEGFLVYHALGRPTYGSAINRSVSLMIRLGSAMPGHTCRGIDVEKEYKGRLRVSRGCKARAGERRRRRKVGSLEVVGWREAGHFTRSNARGGRARESHTHAIGRLKVHSSEPQWCLCLTIPVCSPGTRSRACRRRMGLYHGRRLLQAALRYWHVVMPHVQPVQSVQRGRCRRLQRISAHDTLFS